MGRGVSWTPPQQRPQVSPWPFVGIGGLACCLFLILASVQLWPWWATLCLLAVWTVGFAVALRWWTPRPHRVAWVPVVVFAAWFGFVLARSR